ncbi:uncharacterized protein YALI1_E30849g [Yarrowia lipolytica]|uniref:Uncharacterized protein n=1 Tax=Yarrowia lipolytica TaxID=4952 RepID=A0A1D8NK02_YARLL|nr:hypothetical protein YALI1_E30849g [Yarrowia lipolytica]
MVAFLPADRTLLDRDSVLDVASLLLIIGTLAQLFSHSSNLQLSSALLSIPFTNTIPCDTVGCHIWHSTTSCRRGHRHAIGSYCKYSTYCNRTHYMAKTNSCSLSSLPYDQLQYVLVPVPGDTYRNRRCYKGHDSGSIHTTGFGGIVH